LKKRGRGRRNKHKRTTREDERVKKEEEGKSRD
jgi:hypothetical protein